ncbi:allatotropins-like [Anopheles maculipalpis]|uniref:allatotropins-like n=1 Tax=Anopheles maculipalpis TaxID=1496333 RepID=UPI0021599BB5|nr:allatotropins-like [Anopheles maculipalpis]
MEIMKMSINKLLLLVALSTVMLCCQTSEAGPARQLASLAARASKIPRSIRAPFRNSEMMTARGFGKRRAPIGVSFGSGRPSHHTLSTGDGESVTWTEEKQDIGKLMEDLASLDQNDPQQQQQQQSQAQQLIMGDQENSFPLEWFANEMSTNPTLAKSILQRFVDTNRDGLLETNELMPGAGANPNEIAELF